MKGESIKILDVGGTMTGKLPGKIWFETVMDNWHGLTSGHLDPEPATTESEIP